MDGANNTAIGIDVGGTNIRAALVRRDGTVLTHASEPVVAHRDGFTQQLVRLAAVVGEPGCQGVGVGIPGRVNAAQGTVISAGFLDIAGLDLVSIVHDRLALPARIENDATMALLGEASVRGAETRELLAMITVGTGIGGAILAGGRPWYGGGLSGQFGHLMVAEDGPVCKCGRHGCVETMSSGTALGRLLAEAGLPGDIPIDDLFQRAASGSSVAIAVLENWARPFQRALHTLVATIDPSLIIVGGGLGGPMARALRMVRDEGGWFDTPVDAAILGDDAGAIGAGLSCFTDA